MFGGKKESFSSERVDTIIGKDTRFKGSLQGTGTLRIDGYIEGDIATQGDIVVGEGGVVKATVKARNCTVAGEVFGDIVTQEKLEIASSGKVFGNIKAENLIIGEGAIFRGACEMKGNATTLGEAAATIERG
jgi:cytoskeletal protein CcmA (bactofilin family)